MPPSLYTFQQPYLAPRLPHNAPAANVHLSLVQLLRYAACTDFAAPPAVSPEAGVLGFSTGMFAAAVIACADTIPRFIAHATEACRLAFWLGLRAQQHARRAVPDVQMPEPERQSWTLVTFGSSRAEVQDAVNRYNAEKVRCVCLGRTWAYTQDL